MAGLKHLGEDGTLLVRDNLVLALFAQAPLSEVASGFRHAMERWLEEIPRESLAWSLVGASAEYCKPIGPRTIALCLSRLKEGAAPKGELTYFIVQGPEEDNPSYRFELHAQHVLKSTSSGNINSSFIEIRMPSDFLDRAGPDGVASFAEDVASAIPYDSGYLAPAASWSSESDLYLASKIIAPLGLRHPGLDISFNGSSCFRIGKRCRGPYWITFLGKDLVKSLGGPAALQAALPPEAMLSSAGCGVGIRAGERPETGDVEMANDLPLLRAVARALEPVTFFGDTTIKSYLFNNDEVTFKKWDRRLLD